MNPPSQRRPGARSSPRPAPRVRPQRGESPRAEIVSIGRELLTGRVADRNAATLARLLTQRGVVVRRITTVGDGAGHIATALREALERNPRLVVTSGGLGPAAEDRTLEAAASVLAKPLTLDHRAKTLVEDAYRRLRRERTVMTSSMTASREKMCSVPTGGIAVANPEGVAPGVICRIPGGAALLCLPGVPGEMEATFHAALAELKLPDGGRRVAQREVEAPTADEAWLRPMLDRLSAEFPDVWIQSRPRAPREGSPVMVRVEATGDDAAAANQAAEAVIRRLLALAAGSP